MSEENKPEALLDRWSRRKREQAQEQERVRQEATPVAPVPAEARPAEPLPAIEDLKPDSDFKPFMDPGVDAGTRRSALKKLFTDAHFNAVDPFEPYSIDLTGEEPIPEAMLKTLNHAKRLLFDEKQPTAEAQTEPPTEAQTDAQTSPQPQAQKTEPDVPGKQDA